MRSLVIGLAISALATQAPAFAQPQPQPVNEVVANVSGGGGAPVASKPQPALEKKVCRRIESSYSHMSEKICLTKKEWHQVDAEVGR